MKLTLVPKSHTEEHPIGGISHVIICTNPPREDQAITALFYSRQAAEVFLEAFVDYMQDTRFEYEIREVAKMV